jgi:hypothetical protein
MRTAFVLWQIVSERMALTRCDGAAIPEPVTLDK